MIEAPPGYVDILDDAERSEPTGGWTDADYHPLEIEGIGTVWARRPMPNSAAALAMAANSKIEAASKVDYLGLFARNHLRPDELPRILAGQMTEQLPADAFQVIAREIATWGTARPTRRSSRSA